MKLITLSVCMIVKNEEKVLARCLDSLKNLADEIIVVDTGSSDKTKEIARRYAAKIYDYAWADNFADARNFSFSKATKDYIYTADADEVLDADNANKFLQLKKSLSDEIEIVEMKYANQLEFGSTYNFDVEYRPKLYKRLRTFRWIYPLHEIVDCVVTRFKSDITVQHMPLYRHSARDFSIFLKLLKANPSLPTHLHRLYARELYIAGADADFLEAFPYFESTLHDENLEEEDIRMAQCIVAKASRLKNEDSFFFKTALKNVVGGPCAEVCCELGEYYFSREDYEEAATWFYTAAYGAESELNIHTSGDIPLQRLSECYYRLGLADEGAKYKACAEKWEAPAIIGSASDPS